MAPAGRRSEERRGGATYVSFERLEKAHPGRGYVCDTVLFANQCAMRMGTALRAIHVDLEGLKTCVSYDRIKFKSLHPVIRGLHRSWPTASTPGPRRMLSGRSRSRSIPAAGSIRRNIDALKDKQGMIFIMNGWGSTDHIDVWEGDGASGTLKGGFDSYLAVGSQAWLWEFS